MIGGGEGFTRHNEPSLECAVHIQMWPAARQNQSDRDRPILEHSIHMFQSAQAVQYLIQWATPMKADISSGHLDQFRKETWSSGVDCVAVVR